MDLSALAQGSVEQKARVTGKGIGFHRFALDQARIAKRCFLSGCAPVHQSDFEAALLQMQSSAGADHTGAQNEDGSSHVRSIETPQGLTGLGWGDVFALFKLLP
jgi:hypothetical protein